MNERIKELAKSLKYNTDFKPSDDETDRGYQVVSNDFAEKFAKSIVAECLVTLDSIVCDTSGERDTLWVARKVVADHFGVE